MKLLILLFAITSCSYSAYAGLRNQQPKAWKLCHTYCAGKYSNNKAYNICMNVKGYSCGILATKGVFYGNYCGIGNFSPKKPIDVLDVACQQHDACWVKRGKWNCKCDRRLAKTTRKISRSRKNRKRLKEYAHIVAEFWEDSPCQ